MYISYDYYRIFYYVAKYGNFTQAAQALMNNQPNITRTIKNLEAELSCTLFVRSNRGVTLTPEGERLFAHISTAIESIQAGEEEISLERTLKKGLVTAAGTETLSVGTPRSTFEGVQPLHSAGTFSLKERINRHCSRNNTAWRYERTFLLGNKKGPGNRCMRGSVPGTNRKKGCSFGAGGLPHYLFGRKDQDLRNVLGMVQRKRL